MITRDALIKRLCGRSMICCLKRRHEGPCRCPNLNEVDELFPSQQKLWDGKTYTCLGSGIKYRKLLFFKIQLYAVALYVDEDAARTELQRLDRKGFFQDHSVDSLCAGLQQGNFQKFLDIRLLRTVTFSQFTDEIGRDLKPRLDEAGADEQWEKFTQYFHNKSLANGANLLALTLEDRSCEGGLCGPEITDFLDITPDLTFDGEKFSGALLDVYLGTGDCVPAAKTQWADSAQKLLTEAHAKS